MAKLRGPLCSVSASGSIAGTITLLSQFRRSVAKKKSAPTGAPSAAQLARRDYYRAAAADWSALTPEQKAAYRPAADLKQITPFNEYMSQQLAFYSPGGLTIWDAGATTWDAGFTVWI